MRELDIQFDGGSRGNPGPAGIGVVILEPETGDALLEFGEYIGSKTNNQAEYTALLRGLETLTDHLEEESDDPEEVTLSLTTDSQLLQKQLIDQWDTNDARLQELQDRIRDRLDRFGGWSIRHVPREQNTRADRLVNEALDRRKKKRDSGNPTEGRDDPDTTIYLTVHGTGGSEKSSGTWSFRVVDDEKRELFLRKEDTDVDHADIAVYRAVLNALDLLLELLENTEGNDDGAAPAPERTELVITGVNDVVIKQISGEYRCNAAAHRRENEEVQERLDEFHTVRTRRAKEAEMDALKKADELS